MVLTQWIRVRQTATTCEHQYAVELQVQLQDEMRRRSNVTATLWVPRGECWTLADRWKPEVQQKTFECYINSGLLNK